MTKNGCTTGDCPPHQILERFIAGSAHRSIPRDVGVHIESCERCQGLLDSMTSDEALAQSLVNSWPDEPRPTHFLPPLPPTSIDGYLLRERLSEGAQGVVYRAVSADDPAAQYAIKVCRPCDRKTRHRFEREAAILQQVRHGSVPRVYRYGAVEHYGLQLPYIVLDLISGDPITDYVQRNRLGAGAIVALVARCCEPLQSAHARGIVHRDIKPRNILVRAGGQPVLIDFGIARSEQNEDGSVYMTSAQQVLGTLAYMSPEQLRGDHGQVGPWSDVFGLGVVLFELLTGRHPFESVRHKPVALLRAVEDHSAAAMGETAHWRNFPAALEHAVSKALHPDPTKRHVSASEFRIAILDAKQTKVWNSRFRWSTRLWQKMRKG